MSYHPSIRKTHSDSGAWAKMNFRLKWMGDRLRCLICLGYFIINLFASIYFNVHSQESLIYEDHFFFFFLKNYFTPWFKATLCSFSSQLPRVGLLSSQLLQLYVKHVLVPWPVERVGPAEFAFGSPARSPVTHPSLRGNSPCTALADSEKTRGWIT